MCGSVDIWGVENVLIGFCVGVCYSGSVYLNSFVVRVVWLVCEFVVIFDDVDFFFGEIVCNFC